jgi:hypothetical protein
MTPQEGVVRLLAYFAALSRRERSALAAADADVLARVEARSAREIRRFGSPGRRTPARRARRLRRIIARTLKRRGLPWPERSA